MCRQFAESFNFNPHKWMLVNFDCSAMWLVIVCVTSFIFVVIREFNTPQANGQLVLSQQNLF